MQWLIIDWTLRNKVQWNFYWNWNIFIDEIAFENVVCQSGSHLVEASMFYITKPDAKFSEASFLISSCL